MGSRSAVTVSSFSLCMPSLGFRRFLMSFPAAAALRATSMRNAHVLVSHIGGLATEVIKNVVLSGIGTLSVVDPGKVSPEDLAAGFFFREEDIGRPVSLPLVIGHRRWACSDARAK